MKLEVPEPHDVFDLAMDDGAILHMRRYGDAKADVRMFVSHGNGFAVDGYVPFWEPLTTEFELIVFDFRNHGRNAQSDPANHHYDQMARDVYRIFQVVLTYAVVAPLFEGIPRVGAAIGVMVVFSALIGVAWPIIVLALMSRPGAKQACVN